MPNIAILDIFSGAGGLSQGFRLASKKFSTIAAVELDKYAAATFSQNFPEAEIYAEDIQMWAEEEAHKYIGLIDVIIGGPPCQGFSTLGKRDTNDDRNSLWESYVKIIELIKPKYFIMENVAIFFKSDEYRRFIKKINSSPIMNNYNITEHLLNAADFGSPQNRKRAIVLGYNKYLKEPKISLPTHSANSHNNLKVYKTVGETFKGIPLIPDGDHYIDGRTVTFKGEKLPGPYDLRETHWSRNYTDLSLQRFSFIPKGGNRFDLPDDLKAPCWRRHTTGSSDVMGRLHKDKPSVTIRTEFFKPEKGRYLHPTENRAITHYEAGKIQGFPNTYKFVGSKTQIAKQIGNAVPIQLGKVLGQSILEVENFNEK